MQMKIPVYRPHLHGNEKKYLNKCLDSTWISSKGEFIDRFEESFCAYVKAPFALSVCNGTVALHLALLGLGIGPDDEVIVPSLTYVASVNAIAYVGAKPIFADSLASTWQIDPQDVKRKITPKTRAILAVHLYGHPCDLEQLRALADEEGLFLIEDCAEAFGSYVQGRHVGSYGDVATYSFFGNKTITTGEGGMVTVRNPLLFQKMAVLKNQGNSPERAYWHDTIGYNYRMTNLAAALGLAQIEQAEEILHKKRRLAGEYARALEGLPVELQCESPGYGHSFWMVSLLVKKRELRDPLRDFLALQGIETRPFFHPIHHLPMYKTEAGCPVAEDLSSRGISVPSFPDLTLEEVACICAKIQTFYTQNPSSCLAAEDMREVSRTSS